LSSAAVQAADLGSRRAAPQPRYTVAPYNWSGFYAGINGGYGWGSSDFSTAIGTGSFDTDGGLVGGTLGYNWQLGSTVFGAEGDLDWTNLRGSALCNGGATVCETKNNWLGTLRGRVGYAADRFMPYVTGGLAVGDIKSSIAGVGSSDSTKAGWTVGGGLEFALPARLTAKVEYLYVDLGRGGSVLGSDASFRSNILRVGLNYRF
jgi:outer membrane immunogenic protein